MMDDYTPLDTLDRATMRAVLDRAADGAFTLYVPPDLARSLASSRRQFWAWAEARLREDPYGNKRWGGGPRQPPPDLGWCAVKLEPGHTWRALALGAASVEGELVWFRNEESRFWSIAVPLTLAHVYVRRDDLIAASPESAPSPQARPQGASGAELATPLTTTQRRVWDAALDYIAETDGLTLFKTNRVLNCARVAAGLVDHPIADTYTESMIRTTLRAAYRALGKPREAEVRDLARERKPKRKRNRNEHPNVRNAGLKLSTINGGQPPGLEEEHDPERHPNALHPRHQVE